MRARAVRKAIVAAIGATITVLAAALGDDVVGMSETAELVTSAVTGALTVWAVWQIPNDPT